MIAIALLQLIAIRNRLHYMPGCTAQDIGGGSSSNSNNTADTVGGSNETDIGGGSNGTAYIIGGTDVTERVRGYVAVGPGFCGGQLIHPDIVLTAGHCAGSFARGNRVLISALSQTDVEKEERSVAAFVQHENYDVIETDEVFSVSNDIAVVRLNTPSGEPLAAWSTDTSEPVEGDQVRVVGFGRTIGSEQGSGANGPLQETTLTVLSNDDCIDPENPSNFKSEQMACAEDADGDSTPCNGDSGGPFFDTVTDEIVGIVSFGDPGCPLDGVPPPTMTRVSNYDAWIRDKICKVSAVPPADCPGSTCGDGFCTPNAEDEASCPQDCTIPTPPPPPDVNEQCRVLNQNGISLEEGTAVIFPVSLKSEEGLYCRTLGANGDADLGMIFEYSYQWNCVSISADSNEVCISSAADFDSTLFVAVSAFTAFSALDLECQTIPCIQDDPPPTDPPTKAPTPPTDPPTKAPTLEPPNPFPIVEVVIAAIIGFIIGDLLDDGCLFGNGEKGRGDDSRDGWCFF